MVYSWNQIVEKEGDIYIAKCRVKEGKYHKVSHGLYVDNNQHLSELEQLFMQYPRATLTLQSAFDYYGLSDYVPNKYYLVTPYNSHTIKHKKVSQTYMDEKMSHIGREKIKTDYGYIFVFNLERMLIELFRLKAKLPRNYFLEIVSSYRSLKTTNVISFSKVSEYSKQITYGKRILKEIQEMI